MRPSLREAVVARALGELDPLQLEIVAALEAGQYDRLRKLQARFRNEAVVESASRGHALTRPKAAVPSAPRVEPSARETEEIDYRPAAAPRLRVRLSPGARRAITDEIWRYRGSLDLQFETGGWLLAYDRIGASDSEVEVMLATAGPGPHGARRRRALDLDHATYEEAERWVAAVPEKAGLVVGHWHTQPDRNSTPGESDLISMLRMLDLGERERGYAASDFFVALIATSEPSGSWVRPEFAGWAVRRHGVLRTPVVEPAPVN
jgi:hypothetical protein